MRTGRTGVRRPRRTRRREPAHPSRTASRANSRTRRLLPEPGSPPRSTTRRPSPPALGISVRSRFSSMSARQTETAKTGEGRLEGRARDGPSNDLLRSEYRPKARDRPGTLRSVSILLIASSGAPVASCVPLDQPNDVSRLGHPGPGDQHGEQNVDPTHTRRTSGVSPAPAGRAPDRPERSRSTSRLAWRKRCDRRGDGRAPAVRGCLARPLRDRDRSVRGLRRDSRPRLPRRA